MKKSFRHIISFPFVWMVFIFLSLATAFAMLDNWELAKILGIVSAIFVVVVFCKPMNAVYGLMGTTGDIRLFFFNFIFISFVFANIYYWGFFKDAGISYDVNQPHIDYNYNIHKREIVLSDTIIYKKKINSNWEPEVIVQESKLNYQNIGFFYTWRNTILTALMQEPTDFFLAASTYNESMIDPSIKKEEQSAEVLFDKEKAMTFQWILIFQVLISWIFFGVFISLLYNKFRYES